jgi:hypothetical protein
MDFSQLNQLISWLWPEEMHLPTGMLLHLGVSNGEGEWHKIWQLKVPNKVQMFIWRLAHNSLPVRRNLARRGIKTDTLCPVCNRLDEDCSHIFFKFKYVKHCWRLLNMEEHRVMLLGCQSGKEIVHMIVSGKICTIKGDSVVVEMVVSEE